MLILDFDHVAPWVSGHVGCPIPSFGGGAIGWERDGQLVCGVMYEHYTGPCITATIVVEQGAIITKEFVHAIFHYPFVHLKCEQMLAYIADDNLKSKSLVEHMGFYEVARIGGVFPEGAMLIYMMKRGMCRFLGEPNGQEKQDANT